MSKYKKLVIGIFSTIGIIVVGLIIFIAVDLTLPPRFEIIDDVLIIKDTYNEEIDLKGATITLCSDEIDISKRVAGTASGTIRKGSYNIGDSEEIVYISMMRYGEEYILIISEGKHHYLNLSSQEETTELYENLIEINQI